MKVALTLARLLLLFVFSSPLAVESAILPLRAGQTREVIQIELTTPPASDETTILPNDALSEGPKYRLALISDSELQSKIQKGKKDKWRSHFRTGTISLKSPENGAPPNLNVIWDEGEPDPIITGYSAESRGNEFSTLNNFNGSLVTCDDQSGIVYKLLDVVDKKGERRRKQVAWVILADGDGTLSEGFHCEWATVKDGDLWVGGHGNSSEGSYVKKITPRGAVTHLNWAEKYNAIANVLGANISSSSSPNRTEYVTHEAVGWSDYHRKWVFIPTKISADIYDSVEDTMRSSNQIVVADDNFDKIELFGISGELMPTRSVSGFKWLPHPESNHSVIVAIKSEEIGDSHATYILGFDMSGNMLLPETKIEDIKYEGLEFI